jgi:3-hydroxybutyryl-CoA dehydratase
VTLVTFEVDIPADAPLAFAALSGDWNPLHTDPTYAASTTFGQPVLHGAFSAGLVSRMAGMHIPGHDCLLHGLRLRFVAPILPPASVIVSGRLASGGEQHGLVEVTITDAASGVRYVEASYEFGRHQSTAAPLVEPRATPPEALGEEVVLVTGAGGALAHALLERLGTRGLGTSRSRRPGMLMAQEPGELRAVLGTRRVSAIVHCAWPAPDNTRLIDLGDLQAPVEHFVAAPTREVIELASLLQTHGVDGALLLLVGSTAAEPGRHNFRAPLYSLGKSLLPLLSRILAVELASSSHRCVTVMFDVLEGGMNARLSATARIAHKHRIPGGRLPSMNEAAAQLLWLLQNGSWMASGATVSLTGGALP